MSKCPASVVKKAALYRGFKYSVFHLKKFYVNSILGILKVQKLPFWTHLKTVHFYFHEFLHFLKDETYQNNKILGPKISNNGSTY